MKPKIISRCRCAPKSHQLTRSSSLTDLQLLSNIHGCKICTPQRFKMIWFFEKSSLVGVLVEIIWFFDKFYTPLGCWPQMTCSLKRPKVNCISVCWLLLILQLSAWSPKMWTQPHIFWTSCTRNREIRRWGAGETIIFFQQFPEFPLWVARRPQHCS